MTLVELAVVVAVLVVAAVALTAVTRPWGRRSSGGPHRRWAVATATTRDGVTAHVQVEYSWDTDPGTGAPAAGAELDVRVADAVEDALRQLVSERTVAALPGLGDDPGWEPDQFVEGVRVEHVTVTTSEVEVSGELRRLVQDHTVPEDGGWS